MSKPREDQVSADEVAAHSTALGQIALAYTHNEHRLRADAHNFIFLMISTVLPLVSILLIIILKDASNLRIQIFVVVVLPSIVGLFLCVPWYFNNRRNALFLRSMYSATIDALMIDEKEPFLFTVEHTYYSNIPGMIKNYWVFIIYLIFYFNATVIASGVYLFLAIK